MIDPIVSDSPPSEGLVPSSIAGLDDRTVVVGNTNEPLPKFDARGASLLTLAVLATLFALQMAASFVIPVVIGVLLAYALDPAVSFLGRLRIPRWVGAFFWTTAGFRWPYGRGPNFRVR